MTDVLTTMQRRTLQTAIGLTIVMVLFPPWLRKTNTQPFFPESSQQTVIAQEGYRPVWAPKTLRSSINGGRLIIQLVVVWGAAGLVLLWRSSKPSQ